MVIYFLNTVMKISGEYESARCRFPPRLVLDVDHESNALYTIPANVTWGAIAVRIDYPGFTVLIPRNKLVDIVR